MAKIDVALATPRPHLVSPRFDIGITPSLDLEGAENVIPVKPISTFLARFASFDAEVNAGSVRSVGFVGAGAGGVELALAIQYRLRDKFEVDYHLRHHLPHIKE